MLQITCSRVMGRLFLALAVGNSTSTTTNLISAWLSPTGIGTIVLALGVFVAAYQIFLDRTDRVRDRVRQLNERPHFIHERTYLDIQQLILIREGEKVPTTLNIGLLKVSVSNQGETTADEAQPYFGFKEAGIREILLTSKWGLVRALKEPIPITVPSYVGRELKEVGRFLSTALLEDSKWGFEMKRNIPPSASQSAIRFFTLEGCDLAFESNPHLEPRSLPLEGIDLFANIVMNNAPVSHVNAGRVSLKSWNEVELL